MGCIFMWKVSIFNKKINYSGHSYYLKNKFLIGIFASIFVKRKPWVT